MTLYLASASPRRTKLLKKARIPHKVVKTDYEEHGTGSPAALVRRHALGKALSAMKKVRDGRILAADTIVYFKGRIIGKPRNRRDAERTLSSLQGRKHVVYTGVALLTVKEGKVRKKTVFHETTEVFLKTMDLAAIRRYFRRVDPFDKAGAYAIQEKRGSIVQRVKGSFSNAVGLPMERLYAKIGPL